MKRSRGPVTKKEENLRADVLLQSIGEGLIVTDARGVIIKANRAVKRILGLSQNKLLWKSFWDSVLEVDDRNNLLPKDKSMIAGVLKNSRTVTGTAFYLTSKRRKIPVFLTISPIILRGQLTGTIAALRDITEERAVDKAKTEFVSLTSHQLRTPLTTIKWYSQMLLNGDAGELNAEQRDYLDEVLLSANEMTAILNTFLNVSRIELGTFSVEPETIDVRAVVESVAHEVAPDLQKKKLIFNKNYSPSLPLLKADRKLLRVILQNLLTNSVRYTPEGGEISIALSTKDKNFIIVIKDNGYGIPEAEQAQIFKKMFRASNAAVHNTEGTGLGLYLVKSILDSVHGKIRFVSKEGWGTEFYVTLPLSGMKSKKGTKKLK